MVIGDVGRIDNIVYNYQYKLQDVSVDYNGVTVV